MATKGSKTKFEYGDGETVADSETWVAFAKVTDLTPPKPEIDDIDVSHMESPDEWKEYEPGWKEGGEVDVTIQYAKAQNAAVLALLGVKHGFRITFVDGSKWQWDGYLKSTGNEVEREGIVSTVVTVKVSGKPEFVPAA